MRGNLRTLAVLNFWILLALSSCIEAGESCAAFQARIAYTRSRSFLLSPSNKKVFFVSETRAVSPSVSASTDSPVVMVQERTKAGLCGTSVLLTGATGGLGRAFALQLASVGRVAHLVLSARREADLQKLATDCRALSPDLVVHCIAGDLADPASVNALAQKALQSCGGKIDVLINNGGVSSRSRFIDTSWEVDQQCMQINFLSGAALAKAVVPGMIKEKRGRIIWISSVQGLLAIPNRSSYAASKFAVQGYCESLRAELATSGITVHTVSPGYIRTNLSRSALTGDGTTYGVMDPTTEQGADPDELAAAILDRVVIKGENDFTIAAGLSTTIAVWMRFLFPSLLQYLLVKRYEKSVAKEKDD